VLDYEGGEDTWRAWCEGLKPDPTLTISEWADAHRFLSPRASAEPGRYRTDRTPYMRAIMDALSPTHPARRVVFMKAAQVGATEAGNNWIGYVIHHAPGPMLAVQPTVELAKRFSRQRIQPLIAESPALRERVKPSRARDAGNTVLSKEFPAGVLVITGATAPWVCARCRRAICFSTRSMLICRLPMRKAIQSHWQRLNSRGEVPGLPEAYGHDRHRTRRQQGGDQ
jgi:phage terminase large subunit GpA-like protein